MNEKKTILRYIHWFTTPKKIIALILLLAGIGCIVLAATSGKGGAEEPEPFDALSDRGSYYAYLDVVGVSDWVCSRGHTTYYILEDTENLFYAAILSDKDFSSLSQQNRYFNGETDTATPKRLTGMNKSIPSTVRSDFVEALEITDAEFESYFGHRLFNVGESPSGNLTAMWGFFAVLTLAAALTLLLVGLLKKAAENKAIKRLEERGLLEQAATELESPMTQQEYKDRLRLGSRFLFGKGIGVAAAWDDVLWCYRSKSTYEFIIKIRSMVICTADKQAHRLYYRNKQSDEIVALMEAFGERNQDMLLGYSLDTARAYREACKQMKQ